MLTELQIENLGVIEFLQVSFGPGFSVFTGETGTGKTMLVEAISLLVGGRADASVVRAGATESRVEGRFVRTTANGTEEEIVLSRVVPVEGRSRAYINGRMATVASLAEAGIDLVDIHGQHAHQRLLGAPTQRAALDRFANIDLTGLRDSRSRVTEIDAALAAFGGDERARAREIDLLRFQSEEILGALIVGPNEESDLLQEETVLADAGSHREALWLAYSEITQDSGVLDLLGRARGAVQSKASLQSIVQRLTEVMVEAEELATDIRAQAENAEENPERLAEIGARRHLLRDFMRKYGANLEDVIAYGIEASTRLQELEGYDERVRGLLEQRVDAITNLAASAQAVAKARRVAAPRLAAQVEAQLQTLAMPNATLVVEVQSSNEDIDAGDGVVFLLSANPGSPLLPLTKVASGGELARTMLALRLVLSEEPGSLVFDEVDAGIGGAAAVAVASALAQLGRHHQVLAVTHLPQVGAAAHHQIAVTKEIRDGLTFGAAKTLTAEERVLEIARMLSGGVADQSARQHASDLIEQLGTIKTSPKQPRSKT
ncbi:MAG: DNA repair protein RecN [Ilumatobacteraceae bacterium]|nr:DNA repair protein RecN [Ilumatobacteraceae bacterium]